MTGSVRAYRLLLSLFAVQLRATILPTILSGGVLPIVALAAFPALRTSTAVVLVPLLGVTLLVLPPTVARLRRQGQLGYFAGLAIDRFPLLLALLTIYGLIALLGICVTTLVAVVSLHVSFTLGFWSLVVVVPLAYLALAGVGLLLGVSIPGQASVIATSNVVALLLLTGVTPTLAEKLPAFVRDVVGLSPMGLASTALDSFGAWSQFFALATALVLLLLYAAALLLVTAYVIPWRVETRERTLLGLASRIGALPPPPPTPTP